jgi:hypothetical protein
MNEDLSIELGEGTYIVSREALVHRTSAEVLVWLRESWRIIRGGGRPMNDATLAVPNARTPRASGVKTKRPLPRRSAARRAAHPR